MKQFIRDWILIIAMLVGVLSYFIYVSIPGLEPTYSFANQAVALSQPLLIFCMLFLTFCKVNPAHIRLCRWHLWLLLIQGGLFTALALLLIAMPHSGLRVVLEGAMVCLICPTATAAAVVTRKLGGDVTHVTTYTILINLAAAILIPVLVPYVHPNAQLTIVDAMLLILGKVFPLLLLPLVGAILVRYLFPKLHRWLLRYPDIPFYLWAVALTLAIAVTTRSIVHSPVAVSTQLWLVVVSAVCCVAQFAIGRRIGAVYDDKITAGQALGQKNTVFGIWLGYTFFTPVTAIAGGFYSIWHNVINSYQLYRHNNPHK